ncbi:hypothetical protein BHE74_00002802 [Ensete ventricosum]|nr:hypothetical protein BHE74_00002802 [Ensete ventricosum]
MRFASPLLGCLVIGGSGGATGTETLSTSNRRRLAAGCSLDSISSIFPSLHIPKSTPKPADTPTTRVPFYRQRTPGHNKPRALSPPHTPPRPILIPPPHPTPLTPVPVCPATETPKTLTASLHLQTAKATLPS